MGKRTTRSGQLHGGLEGDRLHPALEASLRGEEVADEPTEEEGRAGPRVVVARLADLALTAPQLREHGDRPVWFVLEDDADEVELFLRLPEKAIARQSAEAIFGAMRSFVADKTDSLQEILGVTDSIEIGFHASASLEDVAASFDADGFEVILGAIEAGKLLGS